MQAQAWRWGGRLLATVLLAAVFYQIGGWLPRGADAPYMARLVEDNAWPLYYRSLLTLWIHRMVYLAASPFGFNGWQAISLSSALAGAAAVQVLWAMRPRAGFLLINVLSGSFLVMMGHVENYAWVNCFLLTSFYWVERWLGDEATLWPVMMAWMLAAFSHLLALFYLPAYLFAWARYKRDGTTPLLTALLGLAAGLILVTLTGKVGGTELGMERLVPLWSTWSPNHYFTLFSPEHWAMLYYFHQRAAFLGIPVELPFLFLVLRSRIQQPYDQFLLAAAICGLAWTTVWHPDWGPMDWDLFSQFGIPLHVLIGVLLCRKN